LFGNFTSILLGEIWKNIRTCYFFCGVFNSWENSLIGNAFLSFVFIQYGVLVGCGWENFANYDAIIY
jgi:hypothetical protein